MKKLKKSYLELFLNKLLKSGKKYKYFLILKNSTKLHDKSYKYIPRNQIKTWYYDIINKEELLKKTHSYTFVKKTIKKKKKFKKIISVTKLNIRQDILKESFKLINMIVYKLPIRTLSLKLYYLALVINNKKLKKLKIFRKLNSLYYNNIKHAKKFKKKKTKRKFYWINNEFNINKRFFLKYKHYYDIINTKNKWVYFKKKRKKKNLWRTFRKKYKVRTTLKRDFRKKIQVKYLSRNKYIDRALKKKLLKIKLQNRNLTLYAKNDINVFFNNQEAFFLNIVYNFKDIIKKKNFSFKSKIMLNSFKKRNKTYARNMIIEYLKLNHMEYNCFRALQYHYGFTNRIRRFGRNLLRYKNFLKTFTHKDYKKLKLHKLYWWNIENSISKIDQLKKSVSSNFYKSTVYGRHFYTLLNLNNINFILRVNTKKIFNKNNIRIWKKYKIVSRDWVIIERLKLFNTKLIHHFTKKIRENNLKNLYKVNNYWPELDLTKIKLKRKKLIAFRIQYLNKIFKKNKYKYILNKKNYKLLKKKIKKYLISLERKFILKWNCLHKKNYLNEMRLFRRILMGLLSKKHRKANKKKEKIKFYTYKRYIKELLANKNDDDSLMSFLEEFGVKGKKLKKILKMRQNFIVTNMQLVYSNFVYIINNILYFSIFILLIYTFINYLLITHMIFNHILIEIKNVYLNVYLMYTISLKNKKNIHFVNLCKPKLELIRNLFVTSNIYQYFFMLKNFLFLTKKFYTWYVIKFVTNLLLEKNIFFKFSTRKNTFNYIYKTKKVKYFTGKWFL